jgi:hypothetical protein
MIRRAYATSRHLIRKEHLAALFVYRLDVEQHQKIDRLELSIQRRTTANSRTITIDLEELWQTNLSIIKNIINNALKRAGSLH